MGLAWLWIGMGWDSWGNIAMGVSSLEGTGHVVGDWVGLWSFYILCFCFCLFSLSIYTSCVVVSGLYFLLYFLWWVGLGWPFCIILFFSFSFHELWGLVWLLWFLFYIPFVFNRDAQWGVGVEVKINERIYSTHSQNMRYHIRFYYCLVVIWLCLLIEGLLSLLLGCVILLPWMPKWKFM